MTLQEPAPSSTSPSTRDLIIGSIIDMAGVARGKVVPASRLSSFTRSGMGASPSWNVFCVDDAIAFTPDFSVAGDLRLRIAESDLRDLGDGTRWAPAGFYNQDGTASSISTRGALQRMVARLAEEGLEAVIGHEIEFTLFDASGRESWAAYGLGAVLSQEAFIKDLLSDAAAAQLPIEQVHAEYGVNQFEISLAPARPVEAADNMVLARIIISRVARRHDLLASFSPIPVAEGSGNGAHQHVSFTRDSVPILSGGEGPHGLTPEGEHAIAGLVAKLPEFMAVFAGSPLSQLRLQPGMWSGAWCCWGLENREAAVRFCAATAGNPHGANIEIKSVDPSANPYLSSTAILGMALTGITSGAVLPLEVTINPDHLSAAEKAAAGVALLPTTLAEMIALLHSSELALTLFGDGIVNALLAVKEHDRAAFADWSSDATAERLRYVWSV